MAKKFNDVVAMDFKVVKNGEQYFIFLSTCSHHFRNQEFYKKKTVLVKAFIVTLIDSGF